MARNAEVAVGSYGHIIRITTETDLSAGAPTLEMVFRSPVDELTETTKTATIDTDDATNKTMKYTSVTGDFDDEGEYRIVAKVSKTGSLHYGRPALRVNAAPKFS